MHLLEPIGRYIGMAAAGTEPDEMGIGPVFAVPKLLKRTGLKVEDIGLWELNEAFAAQAIACLRGFESPTGACAAAGCDFESLGPIDLDRVNVNGGAIALGHPVGATGTRLILTLLHELRRRNLSRGLATLCIGGGQGGAPLETPAPEAPGQGHAQAHAAEPAAGGSTRQGPAPRSVPCRLCRAEFEPHPPQG